MPTQRLDPAYPRSVLFATRMGRTDADRLTELIERAGVGPSEYIRSLLLRELERREEPERRLTG